MTASRPTPRRSHGRHAGDVLGRIRGGSGGRAMGMSMVAPVVRVATGLVTGGASPVIPLLGRSGRTKRVRTGAGKGDDAGAKLAAASA